MKGFSMLMISRGPGESIQITVPPSSETQIITLTVTELRPGKARIGFDADRSIRIHRSEIQELVNATGEIQKPAKPAVLPVIKIGDKLPGA